MIRVICNQLTLFLVYADTEEPHITCSGHQSIKADEDKPTAMLIWTIPKSSDNSGIVPEVSCDPQSGTNFTIGVKVVTCIAVDESGNKAECNFQINVTGDYNRTLIRLLCKNNFDKSMVWFLYLYFFFCIYSPFLNSP